MAAFAAGTCCCRGRPRFPILGKSLLPKIPLSPSGLRGIVRGPCEGTSPPRTPGTIAGCYVQSGKITRNAKVRVLRDAAVVFEGEIESLRRFKDDVREVAENFECGIQVARFADLKQGDVIEAYTSELVAPELQPA